MQCIVFCSLCGLSCGSHSVFNTLHLVVKIRNAVRLFCRFTSGSILGRYILFVVELLFFDRIEFVDTVSSVDQKLGLQMLPS